MNIIDAGASNQRVAIVTKMMTSYEFWLVDIHHKNNIFYIHGKNQIQLNIKLDIFNQNIVEQNED